MPRTLNEIKSKNDKTLKMIKHTLLTVIITALIISLLIISIAPCEHYLDIAIIKKECGSLYEGIKLCHSIGGNLTNREKWMNYGCNYNNQRIALPYLCILQKDAEYKINKQK